jgi:hypothetical protein
MTIHTPARNLMIYLGTAAAAKKPRFRLAVVDANYAREVLSADEPRFAFLRMNGRLCYLRQMA